MLSEVELERLKKGADDGGLSLSEKQLELFFMFAKELLKANEETNLTRITRPEEVVEKHFLDSLTPLFDCDFCEGARVIDIGSGAGFPGIPIKIARPDLDILMVDSGGKKVGFVNSVIEGLGLDGICCIQARAEELALTKKDFREGFDIALSRAVAALPALCELCLPFVRVGGQFIALKGQNGEAELKEAQKAAGALGGDGGRIIWSKVSDSELNHSLVIIEKIRKTPPEYPRPFSKILKKHL